MYWLGVVGGWVVGVCRNERHDRYSFEPYIVMQAGRQWRVCVREEVERFHILSIHKSSIIMHAKNTYEL